MVCLLTCQSPGILKMDVVDIALAGTACCFVAMAGAVEAHRRRRRRRSVWDYGLWRGLYVAHITNYSMSY